MSDNNSSKEPPLQTMNGMPNTHNQWMYGIYPQYNGYNGNMYPPFYNQYFNQMGNNQGFPNNSHQFLQNKDHKPDLAHPQFSKPPPTAPLLGMSPLDTSRPFFNQAPIRFNLNNIRKPAPIPLNGNPLLSNMGPKKKRKKNGNYKVNEMGMDSFNDVQPPLPDHPPPLPPLPPPDIPKPPPPPLDVPLPPPLATEDIPQPPVPEGHCQMNEPDASMIDEVFTAKNNNSSNLFKSGPISNTAGTWPDSLERYIKRCYEKCKSAFDRDQIDICLKGRITAAANKDEIWTRNWDDEPIPSVHSERNNLSVKPVRGTLSLYQKLENIESPKGRGLLSGRGFGGHKNTPQRRRRPHSRSRTHSRSPSRKRLSASSGDELEEKKTSKGKTRQKVKDRLSLDQKKPEKYQKHANKKKAFEFVVEDFQGNAERLLKRAERFGNTPVPSIASSVQGPAKREEPSLRRPIIQDTEPDYEEENNVHIIGTCFDIEKSFLRLTRAPEACEVRPLSVLINSLKNVKQRWIDNQDYRYACDQLKSIRQDLTVQGIRDSFTVEVYETHARIALEKGDHEEFNQCQTQLKMLYCELPDSASNISEFTAYRILYYIFTNNTLDIGSMCKVLPKESEISDECMIHAMKTRHAWSLGNMRSLFRLYKSAPKMGGYLMDWFVDRERKKYLKFIIKSYRQTVPVDYIVRELVFESTNKALEFLNQFPLSYNGDQSHIDCKASQPVVASF